MAYSPRLMGWLLVAGGGYAQCRSFSFMFFIFWICFNPLQICFIFIYLYCSLFISIYLYLSLFISIYFFTLYLSIIIYLYFSLFVSIYLYFVSAKMLKNILYA